MAHSIRIKIDLVGDEIVVTLPGTRFKIIYQRSSEVGIVAKSDWMPDDQDAPITVHEFRAVAWKSANDMARELGWIA